MAIRIKRPRLGAVWDVPGFLSTIVVALAFLPYFRPTAFHMALLGLVAFKAISRGVIPFSLFALYTGLLLSIYAIWANGGIVALNLLILPMAVSVFKKMDRSLIISGAKVATVVLMIGLVVELVRPELLENVFSGSRGSVDRGFKSFTAEPSFLGFLGLSLAVTFLFFSEKWKWVLMAVGLSLASLSLSAILPLALTFLTYFLSTRRFLELLLAAAAIVTLLVVVKNMDLRMSHLINILISDWRLVLLDTSFSNRLVRAISPLMDAYHNNFLPQQFPERGDIGVSVGFIADDSDRYVSTLPNLTTILVYVFGVMSLPLFAYYVMRIKSPMYVVIAVVLVSNSLLSIAIGYLFLLIALSMRGAHAGKS